MNSYHSIAEAVYLKMSPLERTSMSRLTSISLLPSIGFISLLPYSVEHHISGCEKRSEMLD